MKSTDGSPTYADFFRSVLPADRGPYDYQKRLASEPWPEFLDVPTGLGKTAAVTLAWLFKRVNADEDTPRRLVWCLPMRVLVEQTRTAVDGWLDRAAPFFHRAGRTPPRAYTLMGGDADHGWAERPEDPAILIGTQDMLLSRMLMRGYGASRYRWPIDFALLHNDALWVYDEVQLMGAGLATSAQLEGFRRDPSMPPARPARSLWVSATLRPEWLDTIDFRPHLGTAQRLGLTPEDTSSEAVRRRLEAPKRLERAAARLTDGKKAGVAAYIAGLAAAVEGAHTAAHTDRAPTVVIVNRVERAQELYRALQTRAAAPDSALRSTQLLLLHARFRQAERDALNRRIREVKPDDDLIVVATQAIEAGVDLTSRVLFTELAPWASLVQRFGRCNRGGEYDDAAIHWLDIDASADPKLAPPYDADALAAARSTLESLTSATIRDLPRVSEPAPQSLVLRRKDFLDLFNTDPDLSGFDVDVSPYIRDTGTPQLQVFWRDYDDDPGDAPRPARAELCPVSLSQIREHLGKAQGGARTWDR